jgi:hypothetical protein
MTTTISGASQSVSTNLTWGNYFKFDSVTVTNPLGYTITVTGSSATSLEVITGSNGRCAMPGTAPSQFKDTGGSGSTALSTGVFQTSSPADIIAVYPASSSSSVTFTLTTQAPMDIETSTAPTNVVQDVLLVWRLNKAITVAKGFATGYTSTSWTSSSSSSPSLTLLNKAQADWTASTAASKTGAYSYKSVQPGDTVLAVLKHSSTTPGTVTVAAYQGIDACFPTPSSSVCRNAGLTVPRSGQYGLEILIFAFGGGAGLTSTCFSKYLTFACSSIYTSCDANGLLLPLCKSTCDDFAVGSQCLNELQASDSQDRSICPAFGSSPTAENVCSTQSGITACSLVQAGAHVQASMMILAILALCVTLLQ